MSAARPTDSRYERDGNLGLSNIEAFAVIACDSPAIDAVLTAREQPALELKARTQPVVVDTAAPALHTFEGTMWWGSALNGYKRRRMRKYLVPPS